MKIENLIILRDKKKFILYLLLIIVSLFMLNLLFYVSRYISYYIDSNIGNNEVNRIYYVKIKGNNKNNIQKILEENKNKLDYYYYSYNLPGVFYNDMLLNIENLKSIESNINQDYLMNNIENVVVTNSFLNSNNLQLNDSIDILVNDKNYNLKIVDSVSLPDVRNIYLTDDLINLIADDLNLEINEYIFKVKDIKYANDIKFKFSDADIRIHLVNETGLKELESYESIKSFLKYITAIICFSILILLYWIVKDIYYNERKNISIKKLVGYNSFRCILAILYKLFIYVIFGIISSAIIIIITKKIIMLATDDILIVRFLSDYKIWGLSILSYIIFIILCIISLLLNIKRIIKLNPIIELNKE